ncbi:MAG: hypothetical protein HY548_05395 [Elusimicrobia bacterium]|nr:hypothetical protein [Elusimicrobiota bacterium]
MFWGLAGLLLTGSVISLLRRFEELSRLEVQIAGVRATLESLFRQRREYVDVWCSLCGESSLLAGHMTALKKALSDISRSQRKRTSPSPRSPDQALFLLRLEKESHLGRLIREAYADFLTQVSEEGPHQDFFRQYLKTFFQFENDMGDARELYQDSHQAYQRGLQGWRGRLFYWWKRKMESVTSPVEETAAPPRWIGGASTSIVPSSS